MKNTIFLKKGKRFAPIVLSLFSALLLIMPSAVQAGTVTVTPENSSNPVGATLKVTATTDESLWWPGLHFAIVDGPNSPYEGDVGTIYDNGIEVSTFTYVSNGQAGVDTIEVYANYWDGTYTAKGSASVEWIDDSPKSASVDLVARPKLNVKRKGALKVAICSSGNLRVHDVNPESMKLMGVEPVRWKYKDKDYCPGGEDGFVDLVVKFKNREVVKSLEGSLKRPLVDGEEGKLQLTGSLHDRTPIEENFTVEIINKGKNKGKKCKKKKIKKDKKEKMAKK